MRILKGRLRRAGLALALCALMSMQVLSPAAASPSTQEERNTLGSINRARIHHGQTPVRLRAYVSRIARRHSRSMAAQGGIFHSCLDCMMRRHGWTAAGENVGYAASARRVSALFMQSPPHRENVLCRCFNRVGIGVVRAKGRTWVTEIFFRP